MALDEAHQAMGRMLATDGIEPFEIEARRLIGCVGEAVLLVHTVGHDESTRLGRVMETEEALRRMWFDSWFEFEARAIFANVLARAWETGNRDAFAITRRSSTHVPAESPIVSRRMVDELYFRIDSERSALHLCAEYLRAVSKFCDAAVEEVCRLGL